MEVIKIIELFKILKKRNRETDTQFAYDSVNAKAKITAFLDEVIDKNVVIVCIGEPRVWFDSLGPIIGAYLKEFTKSVYIYGTIDNPITKSNLIEKIKAIKILHQNQRILAIDASVSDDYDKGTIVLKKEGLFPGRLSGLNYLVGDYSITCVTREIRKIEVDTGEFNDIKSSFISSACKVISESIEDSIKNIKQNKTKTSCTS